MLTTPNKPYYDDYDELKGFLKILFKPGLAVQTRELNQLQSIIQNQLGILSNTIFKEGSPIKDGAINIVPDVNYAKFVDIYNNNILDYTKFQNRMVYGLTTGITGRVINGFNKDSYYPTTMYFNYLSSGINQEKTFAEEEVIRRDSIIYIANQSGTLKINSIIKSTNELSTAKAKILDIENNKLNIVYLTDEVFIDNEQIISDDDIIATYISGETEIFDAQIESKDNVEEPIGIGIIATVSNGIYYVDGYFVNVEAQSIIVSKYNEITSSKIGFNKEVKYISSTDDESLFDNANGEPNENAPGADRLKINLKLGSYGLYEPSPSTFMEIVRIENSTETFNNSLSSQWSGIMDLLARRTFDESGSYVVNPFILDIHEFLDDGTNNGIYKETYFGYKTAIEANNASVNMFNTPMPGTSHLYLNKYYPLSSHSEFLDACKDRIAIGIEPGKGYILGYEVDLRNKKYIPALKARDVALTNNTLISIKYGNYCLVNEVKYLPDMYHYDEVELCSGTTYDSRQVVGTARVRLIKLETTGIYRLYLTDINMKDTNSFSNNVNSIFAKGGANTKFSCQTVKENGRVNLYDIDKTVSIYEMPQNYISSISDNSYYITMTMTGTIQSNGLLSITSPDGTYFYSRNSNDYILTMTSGSHTGEIVQVSGISFNSSMTNLSIELGSDYAGATFMIIFNGYKTNVSARNVSINRLEQQLTNSEAIESVIKLNVCAGYKLIGIYDSEDPNVDATSESKDITSNFDFDNGQTDTLYDYVKLRRKTNTESPTGKVKVVLDYLTFTQGDFLSVNSYTQVMDISEIPQYINNSSIYDLSRCIDMRPTADEINSITAPRILATDTFFSTDISYYQPRIDILELDYLGNFKVKQGTPSDNPLVPATDVNAICLYQLEIPSYTENILDIILNDKQNRRYTMYEISLLERRISSLENYIIYAQNDYNAENITLLDKNNYPMINVGFFSDNFNDHSNGDLTTTNYKCAIDITNNTLRPSYKLNTLLLEKDTKNTSTVVEYNGKYMLPKIDRTMISQLVGTSAIRMNSAGIVNWTGNLLITPSYNNNYNNIDQQQVNYKGNTDYLNEYNASLSEKANTLDYNQVLLKWLGVN